VSVKRYRAVLDRFIAFAKRQKAHHWRQVNKDLLTRYGRWLEDEDYGYATQYLELTTIKQVIKWMVGEAQLPATSPIALNLRKPQGTTTYCYTQAQVRAIIHLCRQYTDLDWLADAVVALATTGLRIGELAGLRWSDVNLKRGLLQLRDTTHQLRKSRRHKARTTKSHRDRALPIHDERRAVLARLRRSPDGRVFHGPQGGKLKPDTVRNVLKREVLPALAAQFPRSGDYPGIMAGRLHSLRHFFCSTSADNGVPEQMLMSWLGHRDSRTIRQYYHLRQEEARKRMARIRFLGRPPTGRDRPKAGEP
jgi:integrase